MKTNSSCNHLMSHHKKMWRNAWLSERKKSIENEAICDNSNLCPVKSFRSKQQPYSGDCVYTLIWLLFISSDELSGTQLMYISFKMPKMYTNLLSCPSRCYEKRWWWRKGRRRRKKHLHNSIEMVNGVIVECRAKSAHDVCVCCVCMNCTRNQSILRVIKDHFKPKMVKWWIWTTVGICVKSPEHDYVTFWNVCTYVLGSFGGTQLFCRDFLSIKNDWTLVIPSSPSSSSIWYLLRFKFIEEKRREGRRSIEE